MKKGDSVTDFNGHSYFIHDINGPLVKIAHYFKYKVKGIYEFKIDLAYRMDLIQADLEGYSEEEINFLINLALDTNDKEWFQELMRKRESLKGKEIMNE
ncbi:MAG: IDEAL domain-containing protein [Bacillus sp. (in: firmicutes)]